MTAAERAQHYASKVPPAISGQGGHMATFKLAAKLTRGFDLGSERSFPILKDWNQGCQPPWTDADLWHKLRDAEVNGKEARGSMLAEGCSGHPVAPLANP